MLRAEALEVTARVRDAVRVVLRALMIVASLWLCGCTPEDPRESILRAQPVQTLDELATLRVDQPRYSIYTHWKADLQRQAQQSPADSERIQGQIFVIDKLERKRRDEWERFVKSISAGDRIFHGVGVLKEYRKSPIDYYAIVTQGERPRFYWIKGPYDIQN